MNRSKSKCFIRNNLPKTIDAVRIGKKYVDASTLKARIGTAISATAFVGAIAAIGSYFIF